MEALMKAILWAEVKADFSFLTRRLTEHWNNFEAVGNACGVSFHSEVGEFPDLHSAAGWHLAHVWGQWKSQVALWDGSDRLDMEIETLPKSKFADYMGANNLVLRRLGVW